MRAEVPRAVTSLRRAGVTTRMITGDGTATARAIALETGIITVSDDAGAVTTGYRIA